MSEKYVIELDDEELFVKGHSYRRISGTNTLICDDDIKNLAPSKVERKTIKNFKLGDTYFYIDDCGCITTARWDDDNIDRFRKDCGNAFLTRNDAEFALKRIDVIAIIRKYAEPLDTQLDYKKEYFKLVVQLEDKKIIAACFFSWKSEGFFFATENDAKKVIDEVGEADLLTYYFMIED